MTEREEPRPGLQADRRVPLEPLLVEVEMGGAWWRGTLTEWARWDERGWLGYCSWPTGPGSRYLRWVPADRVRARDE